MVFAIFWKLQYCFFKKYFLDIALKTFCRKATVSQTRAIRSARFACHSKCFESEATHGFKREGFRYMYVEKTRKSCEVKKSKQRETDPETTSPRGSVRASKLRRPVGRVCDTCCTDTSGKTRVKEMELIHLVGSVTYMC